MGIAFIGLGHFDEAVAAAKNALQTNQTYGPAYRCLAAALAHLGRDAEARKTVAQLLEIEPHFRISEWVARTGQWLASPQSRSYRVTLPDFRFWHENGLNALKLLKDLARSMAC